MHDHELQTHFNLSISKFWMHDHELETRRTALMHVSGSSRNTIIICFLLYPICPQTTQQHNNNNNFWLQ
jgi:hypothetical protein